jgi:hypothetical protein
MQRFTHSAVILAPAGIQCVNPAKRKMPFALSLSKGLVE